MKKLIIIALSVALLLTFSACSAPEGGEDSSEESAEASKMPDFTVYTAEGEKVTLYEKLEGPVVINFWATWCPPCKSELPAFDALAKEYEGRVEFMMVDLTDGERETVDGVLSFLSENGYTFPVYYDKDGNAAMLYGVSSIPLTIFLDSEGRLCDYHLGAMTEDALKESIEELLDK